MENKRLEIKVGVFVLIGLTLLAVLLIQFSKSASLFRGSYELHLHTADVGGMKPQADVMLAGVQVGTVSDIKLNDNSKGVVIILKIYKTVQIFHDASFVIQQAGLLGDKYISVNPTSNSLPVLTNLADVYCDVPFDLQETARSASGLINRLDGTAQKLDLAITDLRSQVLNTQTLASFSTTVANLKLISDSALAAVQDIHTIVNTNGAQLGLAVSNLVGFSDHLNQLAVSAQSVLATNGENISAATKNISDISVTVKQLADDLQAGKGLAGTVLQNQELATNVQNLVANLSITSSNLNQHGLWGILWSHKPAPTNAKSKNR
ncbi:MAG TPA: MlaD family protein [Verrucomicrobiae bacterium]|jgi:phospholipid/cholesterol/gamma-HCH transport system substrate-binding protein